MINTAINIYVQVCGGHIFLFLLGMYLGVELLGYVITLYLTFRRAARLFTKVAATFSIPKSSM